VNGCPDVGNHHRHPADIRQRVILVSAAIRALNKMPAGEKPHVAHDHKNLAPKNKTGKG
jgi:hypothetical protein